MGRLYLEPLVAVHNHEQYAVVSTMFGATQRCEEAFDPGLRSLTLEDLQFLQVEGAMFERKIIMGLV